MSGQPDLKAPPRVVDRAATKRAVLTYPECLACGGAASNGHHVLPKGSPHFGDDVIENIVGLCGTGTLYCHGAFHGNPYEVTLGSEGARPSASGGTELWASYRTERRDREWVARKIGARLQKERPDVLAYVLGKLGDVAGRDYLERVYYLTVDAA